MSAGQSLWADSFNRLALQAGACAWGSVKASELPAEVYERMSHWVEAGSNATMDYLARHLNLKKSLSSVLPECSSILSFAFPYFHEVANRDNALRFSRYAMGHDYHVALRKRLKPLAAYLKDEFGGRTRICVDSAPVAERFWALQCGVGSIGRNGLLYVPGYGSWVFLAEILCTACIPERNGGAHAGMPGQCESCRLCADACPGKAIGDSCTVDCRQCRSYLTIECRDDRLPEGINLGNRIYGCDICQEVCPLNRSVAEGLSDFEPLERLTHLTRERIKEMGEQEFLSITKGTPLTRITLAQLKRNTELPGTAGCLK